MKTHKAPIFCPSYIWPALIPFITIDEGITRSMQILAVQS